MAMQEYSTILSDNMAHRDSLVNLGVGGLIFLIGAGMLGGSWIARRIRASRAGWPAA